MIKINEILSTLTFGYLPKKWKRLIRILFAYWIGFILYQIIKHSPEYVMHGILTFLIPSFVVFFTVGYLLKPFVIKQED